MIQCNNGYIPSHFYHVQQTGMDTMLIQRCNYRALSLYLSVNWSYHQSKLKSICTPHKVNE